MRRRAFALALGLLALAAATGAAASAVAVRVEEARGVYTVQGGFSVSAPDDRVWRVLTDYSRLGNFIPTVRSSTLRRTGPRSVLVAQDTTTTFLAVSRTTRVVLQIDETPFQRLDFTDVSGRDFALYRGAWKIERAGGETRVGYTATAKPRFIPPLVGASLMQDAVTRLLEDLRTEVLRRDS